MRGLKCWLGVAVLASVLIPATARADLGRACATSAECGTGLTCLVASSTALNGEGPAKGLCTLDCSTDESVCATYDPFAVCVSTDSASAYCFEGCEFGPLGASQFDPDKCHGRQEVACAALLDDSGNLVAAACLPQCNSDSDCGGPLKCNPKTGTCGSVAPTGKGLGEVCVQAGEGGTEECKGTCIGFVHQSSQNPFTYMCAENCTLGASPSCGWDGLGTTPAPAACLFVSTVILDNGGGGIGDRGSCGLLCDCNTDCKNPALICAPWTGANAPQLEAYYQKKGYCSDPLQGDGSMNPGLCGPVDAGTGGTGTGGSGAGGSGAGGSGSGGIGVGGSGTGGIGTGATSSGGGPGPGDAGPVDGGSSNSSSSSGCGCRTAASPMSSFSLAWSTLLLLVGLRRRLRRP